MAMDYKRYPSHMADEKPYEGSDFGLKINSKAGKKKNTFAERIRGELQSRQKKTHPGSGPSVVSDLYNARLFLRDR